MSKSYEHFRILLSCPSDITEEKDIIEKEINEFNRLYGSPNSIALDLVHWSTDVFAESGGSPQSLINKQIVHGCDAAIAVFWTRFGTPTEKYNSGTEEEIEELINKGVQVFLYFSHKAVPPSVIYENREQYDKVLQFKERYKSKGFYHSYSTNEEFQKMIRNDIAFYFLKIIDDISTSKRKSQINIGCVENNIIFDSLVVKNSYFSKFIAFDRMEDNILTLFNKIKEFNITKQEEIVLSTHEMPFDPRLIETMKYFKNEKVIFERSTIRRIEEYALQKKISISDNFFEVGNLERSQDMTAAVFRTFSYNYYGTDEEKEKNNHITELNLVIKKYNQLTEYFYKLDTYFAAKLAIQNNGTLFDEDIDIKIIFEKGEFCNTSSLPVPGDFIIEMINEHLKDMFVPSKSVDIDEYPDYPIVHEEIPLPKIPNIYGKSNEEEQKEFQEKYVELLHQIMPYECFSTSENDVIKFKVKYMKHNTAMFLPSLLLFHQEPSSLRYEIRSKNNPEVITGTLTKKIEECKEINNK
jgi:hypothetical protein